VRLLVVGGADVFARDRDGNSPLSLAMAAGQEALGAVVTASNVNARDLLGNRPLHYAAQTGNAAAAEFLLNLGADRGARNSAGDTAAEAAEKRGFMELAGKLR